MATILKYRRVKHAAPKKMKVLAEDLPRRPWLTRLSTTGFVLFVCLAIAASFSIAVLLS